MAKTAMAKMHNNRDLHSIFKMMYRLFLLLRSFSVLFLCGLTAVLVTACGYQLGYQGLTQQYATLSLPYVEGDSDGSLTASIAHQVAISGAFQYQVDGGEVILIVKTNKVGEENIGFRYDRNNKGHLTHSIIPSETRLTLTAEVSLVEAASGRVLLAPVKLTASVDCDHEYNSSRFGVNVFSLGQLSDSDAAFEAAKSPLHRMLAQKIVDYISNSW